MHYFGRFFLGCRNENTFVQLSRFVRAARWTLVPAGAPAAKAAAPPPVAGASAHSRKAPLASGGGMNPWSIVLK